MPTISGTVYDDTGAPAAGRKVRAYQRDTGALLGEVSTGTGSVIPGDPDFDKVSLLLHFDGANGSTVFTDKSASPKTFTAAGTAQISTAQSVFGGASIRLDGSAGHIYSSNIAGARLTSGDFVIECRFRPDAVTGTQCLISQRTTTPAAKGWGIFLNASGQVFMQGNTGTPSFVITPTGTYVANAWHSLTVEKFGSTTKIYVGGVEKGSASFGWDVDTTSVFSIGYERQLSQYPFAGYIDELRITDGVARYKGAFTPAAAPFYDVAEIAATPAGSYTIDTGGFTGEVQRVVLDDVAGTVYNDLIDRVIVS